MAVSAAPVQSGAKGEAGATAPAAPARWRDAWQIPTLAVAGLALAGGLAATLMSAPKPDVSGDLTRAVHQVEAREYVGALETLNTRVLGHVNKRALTPDQEREFFLTRARALAMGQKDAGLDRDENNEAIIAEYSEAQRRGAGLDDRDHYLLGHAYASLGRLDEACEQMERLSREARPMRVELLRRLVESSMRPPMNEPRALDLLAQMSADPDATDTDRLWALARQTNLLVRQEYAPEAIDRAVRTILKARNPEPEALAEAYVELGAAYFAIDDAVSAREKLEQSSRLLRDEGPLMARVNLILARIEHRMGRLEAAKDRFAAVVQSYSFSEDFPAALLGLAEVTAQRANLESQPQDEALEKYEQLIGLINGGVRHPDAGRDRVAESILGRFTEQFAKEDFATALRYAETGERLFGKDDPPADLVGGLAHVHRKLAEEVLAQAGNAAGSVADLDPAAQRVARAHFVRAGSYSRSYAHQMVEIDRKAEADALWAAADDFDRAGDLDDSIAAFRQFAADFPSDTRQPQARFRLAQAFQARGDLELAAKEYRGIIEDRDASPGGTGVLADACFVPLARTLLMDGEPGNDADAERYLASVLGGTVGSSETAAYRDALLETGDHSYRMGRHEAAIAAYEEYVQRLEQPGPGAGAEGLDEVRYKLADSYRLSSAEMARTLASALPDAEAKALEVARRERLTRAMGLFDRARAGLENRARRTALQDVYLRNAHFYMADCAFDLRDFDAAIRLYDAAKDRYSRSPASLVAMAQIVNALLAQGETEKARTANDRAKRFFNSLPESVWDDPALPMTRAGWERWLRSQESLGTVAGANAPSE